MFTINNALNVATDKLTSWMNSIVGLLPNIILALLLIVVFYFIAKGIRKLAIRNLPRLSHNRAVHRLIAGTLYTVIIIAGLFLALNVLGLDKTVTSLLAGVGIIGIALGFAFQDIASNFIAGIILAVQKPFKVGDLVDTNTHFGKVQVITLRTTTIRTNDGLDVLIPNADIIGNPLVNFTKHDERRVELELGVTYDSDLPRVREITKTCIENVDGIQNNSEVEVFYIKFGDSSINLRARFWIPISEQGEYLRMRGSVIEAIKATYDEHGITIPFPIRTIDMVERSK